MRTFASRICFLLICLGLLPAGAEAQNRGVYPLGMSATGSGITPKAGFTYANQLLYYSRDHGRDDAGNTLPVMGGNYVLMDMNTFAWVSSRPVIAGARYSAAVTLPFAKNSLTTDVAGRVSGGGGFADSYYMPFILGWSGERVSVRAIYGFLAPTGRFTAGATDNVGSGYWTHAFSSGQTWRLAAGFVLSAFQMYELHTEQEGTGVHPGDTFDLDYSALKSFAGSVPWQIGLAGYEARQTTARTGPSVSAEDSQTRYHINALGVAATAAFPERGASLALKLFKEFSNRSTYQGYSAQILGSLKL